MKPAPSSTDLTILYFNESRVSQMYNLAPFHGGLNLDLYHAFHAVYTPLSTVMYVIARRHFLQKSQHNAHSTTMIVVISQHIFWHNNPTLHSWRSGSNAKNYPPVNGTEFVDSIS